MVRVYIDSTKNKGSIDMGELTAVAGNAIIRIMLMALVGFIFTKLGFL